MDLSKFQARIKDEIVADIRKFADQHQQDDIYALSLDCNVYETEIILSANSTSCLQGTVTRYSEDEFYKDRSREELTEQLRWATGDWQFMEIMVGYGDMDTWDTIKANIDAELVEEFMTMMASLAVDIERSGLLEELWPGQEIRMLTKEHDESVDRALKRMDQARTT